MAVVQYSNVYRSGAVSGSPVTSIYVCDTTAELPTTRLQGDLAYCKDTNQFFMWNTANWYRLVTETFANDIALVKSSPVIKLIDTAAPANQKGWNIIVYLGEIYIQPTDDAGNALSNSLRIQRIGDIIVGRNIFERNRTQALGQTQFFNFTSDNVWASGGAITLSGANNWFRYALIGDRIYCSFFITANIAAGSSNVYIHTPGAQYTASSPGYEIVSCIFYDSVTGHGLGRVQIAQNQNYLTITKAPITAIPASLVEISGQIHFAFV